MLEIIEQLKRSPLISSFEVISLIDEETIKYVKIKAVLVDGSELWIRESITATDNRYSYHWQKKDGKIILRWDNKPHFPDLPTFPHHKHIGSKKVVNSPRVFIHDVLAEIKEDWRTIDWSKFSAWVYVMLLASLLSVGVYG
jgi:hypothetical protein